MDAGVDAGTDVVLRSVNHFVLADGGVVDVARASATIGEFELHVEDASGGLSLVTGALRSDSEIAYPVPAGASYWLRGVSSNVWTQLDGRRIDLSEAYAGRPDQITANAQTSLALSLVGLRTPWSSTGLDDLMITSLNAGLSYCSMGLITPEAEIAAGATSIHPVFPDIQGCFEPRLVDGTKGDVLEVVHMATREAGPLLFMGGADSVARIDNLEMKQGLRSTASGTMSPLSVETRSMRVDLPGFYQDMAAVHPGLRPWDFYATVDAPVSFSPQFGNFAGAPDRAWMSLTIEQVPTETQQIDFRYGDAYAGTRAHRLAASLRGVHQMTTSLIDGTPRSRSMLAEAFWSANLDASTTAFTSQLGFPRNLGINGTALTADLSGVGVTPELTWEAPAKGSPDQYIVTLDQLTANSSNATRASGTRTATFVLTGTRLRLPPGIILPGNTYTFSVSAFSRQEAWQTQPNMLGLAKASTRTFAAGAFEP